MSETRRGAAWAPPSGCPSQKIAYLSETLARNAATLHALRWPEETYEVYDCTLCPDWHLTTHPTRDPTLRKDRALT